MDWVGTTIDHFGGLAAPYENNTLPTPFAFSAKVRGGRPLGLLAGMYAKSCHTLS